MSDPPESLIQESPLFKSLKVQFNILYNEVKLLRTQLDDSRNMTQNIRNSHLKQIEEMEVRCFLTAETDGSMLNGVKHWTS